LSKIEELKKYVLQLRNKTITDKEIAQVMKLINEALDETYTSGYSQGSYEGYEEGYHARYES